MIIRILLDECLPKKLKYRIEELGPDLSAKTVPEAGWASISNGKLLDKAEQEFDVFVSSDRNLSFQQSIKRRSATCLGLLGLAVYTAEQRTKEIGVRKVLGAGTGNIVCLISKDFIVLVLTGFVMAVPLPGTL